MNTILAIKILIAASAVIYLVSAVSALLKKMKISMIIFIIAWIVNAVVFVMNWIIAGEPPFGSMYHVLIAISLCFLPAYFLMKFRNRLDWLLFYFGLTPVIPLIGCLFMNTDLAWKRMPALQSAWFMPHVASYVLSYSLDTIGFILFLVYCFRTYLIKRTYYEYDYQEAVYRVLLMAFPLMTFGMLSGALWADDAWGGYWSWDVKETWALITWMLYIIYFHCRKSPVLNKWSMPVQALAFISLLITFLVVNFSLIPRLKSLLHAYM